MQKRTRVVNGIGIGFAGLDGERLRDIHIYTEYGKVMIGVNVDDHEAIQYMSPEAAMSFAKAFERCAIAALKESA